MNHIRFHRRLWLAFSYWRPQEELAPWKVSEDARLLCHFCDWCSYHASFCHGTNTSCRFFTAWHYNTWRCQHDLSICLNTFGATCSTLWKQYVWLPSLSHSVAVRQCQSRAARHAPCTILKWLTIAEAEVGGHNLPRKYDSESWDNVV